MQGVGFQAPPHIIVVQAFMDVSFGPFLLRFAISGKTNFDWLSPGIFAPPATSIVRSKIRNSQQP